MVKHVDHCPKDQDYVLKYLILSWPTVHNPKIVYCHKGLKKTENIHIWEVGMREFGHLFS